MKHVRGLTNRVAGAMLKMDPLMGGLIATRMAGKKHHPARLTADAWSRLSAKDQARIEACLTDAAEAYKCAKNDLVWAMDRGGVVHVKKREMIAL